MTYSKSISGLTAFHNDDLLSNTTQLGQHIEFLNKGKF